MYVKVAWGSCVTVNYNICGGKRNRPGRWDVCERQLCDCNNGVVMSENLEGLLFVGGMCRICKKRYPEVPVLKPGTYFVRHVHTNSYYRSVLSHGEATYSSC
jgi:hypothetical protein